MQSGYEKDTCKLCFAKILRISTLWVLERWPPVFRQTHVCTRTVFVLPDLVNVLTDLVQTGISEKVALTVSYISAFLTGMIMAYVKSWRLAIALSFTMFPCVGATGAVMNRFISVYKQ